jgi:plastocyanin
MVIRLNNVLTGAEHMSRLIEQFTIILLLIGLGFHSYLVNADTVENKIHNVEIKKFKFIPATITINPGDTVIWTNKEKRQYHSVWFKEAGDEEPDYFFPDETYQRTFDQAGQFNYLCGPHPKMIGTVLVNEK